MRTKVMIVAASLAALLLSGANAPKAVAPDLTGLWGAKLRFGPDIRGPLLLIKDSGGWRGDIAGFSIPARENGGSLSFMLPDRKGEFRGRRIGRDIIGQWIQTKTQSSGLEYATPITLRPDGSGRWRGDVVTVEDHFTYFLPVTRRTDGSFATYLRNPERNQGRFIPVNTLALQGDAVRLNGRKRGATSDSTFADGRFDSANELMQIAIRGWSFDFARDSESTSSFYPRGKAGDRYRYAPPLALDDGWPVASLDAVGIDRIAIEAFVQWLIDMPMQDVSTSQIHSVLIARHGKLVLEEYFHGFDRDTPHDTRSAAKSLTATLIGAAMQSGIPIRLDTPVYSTMFGGHLPTKLSPRKRAMTLEHLLTMSSGHFCDDSNPEAPGNETTMLDQTAELDYYRFILDLPMDRTPGEKAI